MSDEKDQRQQTNEMPRAMRGLNKHRRQQQQRRKTNAKIKTYYKRQTGTGDSNVAIRIY